MLRVGCLQGCLVQHASSTRQCRTISALPRGHERPDSKQLQEMRLGMLLLVVSH